MTNALTVARRELGAYFVSPIAYVVVALFLFIGGAVFWNWDFMPAASAFGGQPPGLRTVQGFMGTLLLFFAPLLTMRLLSEEQSSGTIELLFTSPVRDWEVVLGKFIAALGLLVLMIAPTLVYALILVTLSDPGSGPDVGPLLTGYLGLLLFGAGIMSLGIFTSSLTRNQVVAAFIGFAIGIVFIIIPGLSRDLPLAWLQKLLAESSPFDHLDGFLRGLIDTGDVIYFLSLIILGLFLATRTLEVRRWS
jgi:ABC-2 type transport system permease protein